MVEPITIRPRADGFEAVRRRSFPRPPDAWQTAFDRAFRLTSYGFAGAVVMLLAGVVFQVLRHAGATTTLDLELVTGSAWDATAGKFGLLPALVGTLYTSAVALFLGGGFGVTTAIVSSQGFLGRRAETVMKNVVELLAAIPSVVYGLWGIYVLIPILRPTAGLLHEKLGFIPLFSTKFSGPGILPASLVLAIMILPTVTALSREAMVAVPKRLAAAAYGLGATRWEVIFAVILPTARSGIFGALVLGFGRALGETMALAMLIGNANRFGWSLLAPGNTLAALLANHFPEAGPAEAGALMCAAAALLAITLAVNAVGSLILMRATRGLKGLGG